MAHRVINPYKHLSTETNKGAAATIAGQAVGQGQPDVQALTTSGVFVDRQTVTIDGDVYQTVDLSTDSTINIETFWNNTNTVIEQTGINPASYTFVVGTYVAVNAEIAIVTSIAVVSSVSWTVGFTRGVAGTTIVAHGTAGNPIEVQSAVALTAGAITVPSVAVTQTAGLDALEAIVGASEESGKRGPGGYNEVVADLPKITSPNWTFSNLDNTTGLLISSVGGPRGAAVTETGTNLAWDGATTFGGATASATPRVTAGRIPTATEVSVGNLYVKFNFPVFSATAHMVVTATGVVAAYNGAVTIVDPLNGIIKIDNSSSSDYAVTNTVYITGHGAPVVAAHCAVVG